jgi:hypothetical protein
MFKVKASDYSSCCSALWLLLFVLPHNHPSWSRRRASLSGVACWAEWAARARYYNTEVRARFPWSVWSVFKLSLDLLDITLPFTFFRKSGAAPPLRLDLRHMLLLTGSGRLNPSCRPWSLSRYAPPHPCPVRLAAAPPGSPASLGLIRFCPFVCFRDRLVLPSMDGILKMLKKWGALAR